MLQAVSLILLLSISATPSSVVFKDPTGDDSGPGTYKYPTDTVYKAGSFDLTGVTVSATNTVVTFTIEMNSNLEDPWKTGSGFAVQGAVVFIDLDGDATNGHKVGIPGQNVTFAAGHGWDRAVLVTPLSAERAQKEVDTKAGAIASSVVVPTRTKGSGRKILFEVPRAKLAASDLRTWRFQVTLGGNESFPASESVLVRYVNEYEGQHRFGGGNDALCDPHMIDVLGGMAAGDKTEAEAQRKQLAYECTPEGMPKKPATLELIKPR